MFDAALLPSLMLTAALVLVVMTLAIGAYAWQQARRIDRLGRELATERGAREDLSRDLAALLDCSREIGARLREQGQRQKSVIERVNEIAEAVDSGPALEQVERLLADGLGVEQISRVCELSQGEAQLLERWKRHRTAA